MCSPAAGRAGAAAAAAALLGPAAVVGAGGGRLAACVPNEHYRQGSYFFRCESIAARVACN